MHSNSSSTNRLPLLTLFDSVGGEEAEHFIAAKVSNLHRERGQRCKTFLLIYETKSIKTLDTD